MRILRAGIAGGVLASAAFAFAPAHADKPAVETSCSAPAAAEPSGGPGSPLGPLFASLDLQTTEDTPAADCIVRPPAPDLFGKVALPVRAKPLAADWEHLAGPSLDGAEGAWQAFLVQAGQAPRGAVLGLVNRWVNGSVRYVEDRGGDRWAPAAETLRNRVGDCEDFAIAKMALLERLGIPADDMFLVVVREAYNRGEHAVLAVRRDKAMYILDNRTDRVLADTVVTDYMPMLGYSGPFAWIYGQQMAQGAVPGAQQASPQATYAEPAAFFRK